MLPIVALVADGSHWLLWTPGPGKGDQMCLKCQEFQYWYNGTPALIICGYKISSVTQLASFTKFVPKGLLKFSPHLCLYFARSSHTEHMELPEKLTAKKKRLGSFQIWIFLPSQNKPQCEPAPPSWSDKLKVAPYISVPAPAKIWVPQPPRTWRR